MTTHCDSPPCPGGVEITYSDRTDDHIITPVFDPHITMVPIGPVSAGGPKESQLEHTPLAALIAGMVPAGTRRAYVVRLQDGRFPAWGFPPHVVAVFDPEADVVDGDFVFARTPLGETLYKVNIDALEHPGGRTYSLGLATVHGVVLGGLMYAPNAAIHR